MSGAVESRGRAGSGGGEPPGLVVSTGGAAVGAAVGAVSATGAGGVTVWVWGGAGIGAALPLAATGAGGGASALPRMIGRPSLLLPMITVFALWD